MQEESKRRLEGLFVSKRKIDAVADAVGSGKFKTEPLGIPKKKVLDALQAKPDELESIGVVPAGLEAIIKRIGRPPLVIRNGAVEIELLGGFPAGTDAKIRAAEPLVGSTGRIEFINHSMKWGGTGWVVGVKDGGHLVLTNRHVARLVAKRSQNGGGIFIRSPISGVRYGASIDFNEEVDTRPQDARDAQVVEITYLADDFSADAALLKVKKNGGDWEMPDPIPLAAREAQNEELVALVGYPAFDSRNDVTDMERYFRDLFDIKRFAPGLIIKLGNQGLLSHDCTSLGGNSGSPVISLEQKGAVGLHFAGVYGVENSAVGLDTLKRLIKGDFTSIQVTIGGVEAADGVHKASDLANRPGYDPLFLGKKRAVPWPVLPSAIEDKLARPSDAIDERPHELRYTHFGVKFSSEFKLPVLTAVNIDGKRSVHIKRGADKWFFDERIPKTLQHGRKAYADAQIDRGHMVRREAPNWGPAAAQADGDTFHYTNSAPQHSALNQGKTMWQGLENYILNSARTKGFKACVITAPVFDDEDPFIEEGIRVPPEFWKVVAMIDGDSQELHVTAYLLSQGHLIRKLLEQRARTEAVEGFVLGPYRTFQIALKDLEKATGYDFGALKDADALMRAPSAQEAVAHDTPVVVPIDNPEDLVL